MSIKARLYGVLALTVFMVWAVAMYTAYTWEPKPSPAGPPVCYDVPVRNLKDIAELRINVVILAVVAALVLVGAYVAECLADVDLNAKQGIMVFLGGIGVLMQQLVKPEDPPPPEPLVPLSAVTEAFSTIRAQFEMFADNRPNSPPRLE